jgi:hypothetical protein
VKQARRLQSWSASSLKAPRNDGKPQAMEKSPLPQIHFAFSFVTCGEGFF